MGHSIQRCWSATAKRRARFLPPERYSHRKEGASAKTVLARVAQQLRTLVQSAEALDDSIFGCCELEPVELPHRAEDMLYRLAKRNVAERRDGVLLTELHNYYRAPLHEFHAALAALTTALSDAPRHGRFTVTVEAALSAVDTARARFVPLPL